MSVKVTVGQSQWDMPQAMGKTCVTCRKRCKSGAKESKRGEIGEGFGFHAQASFSAPTASEITILSSASNAFAPRVDQNQRQGCPGN
jgi:hypothetical protein